MYDVTAGDMDRARGIAAKFARKVPHMADEFESAAMLGLAEAVLRFDPERHGTRFWTYAHHRVQGAIRDVARDSELLGYRRSWRARNPDEPVPGVVSADRSFSIDGNKPVRMADTLPSGDGPVGWEAEYRDEVAGLARRLPTHCAPAFRAFFGPVGGTTMKAASQIAGVSESRVSQIIILSASVLSERFPSPEERFMSGTKRIPEEAFAHVNGLGTAGPRPEAAVEKTCPGCSPRW